MSKLTFEEHQLQLSIAHKIFPLTVIERTLFLLRDWVTSVEVTDNSDEYIGICIRLAPDAPQAMEDLFHSRLINTAVSLIHDESSREIKQHFIQTATAATTEPQRTLKRHLVAQAREGNQTPENRGTYWQNYNGYRVELGGGLDIFVEEHANTFHLDLDDSVYSVPQIQPVVDKMEGSEGFLCTLRKEKSRIIVSITFQKGMIQRVMLETLLDLHKTLRTLRQ